MRTKNKGRVVRGPCCSDDGVFKPDERETRRRLSNASWYVNAKAECRSETNLPQLFVAYVPNEILAPADSHAIEPCKCHGRDQVALRPHLGCSARQRRLAQPVMEGANRIRTRGAERDNSCETRTTRVIRRNHDNRAYLADLRSNGSVKITDEHHSSFRMEGNRHRRRKRAGATEQWLRMKVLYWNCNWWARNRD